MTSWLHLFIVFLSLPAYTWTGQHSTQWMLSYILQLIFQNVSYHSTLLNRCYYNHFKQNNNKQINKWINTQCAGCTEQSRLCSILTLSPVHKSYQRICVLLRYCVVILTPVPCVFIGYNSTNDCTILILLMTYSYIWFAPTCFDFNTSSSGSLLCLAKIT